MSDNGWPGEPGVPLNPETYGAHNLGGYLLIWRPESRDYINHNGNVLPPETARAWPYKGPLSTPAEVDARIATARKDALREAAQIASNRAAAWAEDAIGKFLETKWDYESRAEAGEEIASAILARAALGEKQ
jgi:hypothetical protein